MKKRRTKNFIYLYGKISKIILIIHTNINYYYAGRNTRKNILDRV